MPEFGIDMQSVYLNLVVNYEKDKHLRIMKKTTIGIQADQDLKKQLLHLRSLLQDLENTSSYDSLSKEEKQKLIDETYSLLGTLKEQGIDLYPKSKDPSKIDPLKPHEKFSKDEIDAMSRSEEDEYETLGNHIRQLLTELQSETTDMQNIIEMSRNIRNEINRILENMSK
jgi:hypothetical protein